MSTFETAVNDIAIALDIAAAAQAETGLGGKVALAVIAGLRAGATALQHIAAGNVTVPQVTTEAADLKTEMQGNNEDADNALADKFPGPLAP